MTTTTVVKAAETSSFEVSSSFVFNAIKSNAAFYSTRATTDAAKSTLAFDDERSIKTTQSLSRYLHIFCI